MRLSSKTNWNLYRSFIGAYEAGGYNQAVKLIGISRHNIKANCETLSRQLGVKLFNFNSKGVTPTSDAVRLYPVVKNAVEALIREEEKLKEFTNESEAVIRMIAPATFVGIRLGEFFKNFRQKYPNFEFQFYNRAREENYTEFMLGNIDVIIDLESACKTHGLKVFELMTSDYGFFASKDFLAEKKLTDTISINDLKYLSLICHREYYKKLIAETGLTLKPFAITATLDPIYPLIEQGVGIGIYSNKSFSKQNKNSNVVPLKIIEDIKLPSVKIVYAYNEKTMTKAMKIFIDELISFYS